MNDEKMSEKNIMLQFDDGSFSVMFVEVEERLDNKAVLTKIRTEFHPTNLKGFLKWCNDDWDEESFDWNVKNLAEETGVFLSRKTSLKIRTDTLKLLGRIIWIGQNRFKIV
ncbi:hypothetical protein AKJ62_01365 [candidate division MSBL1 archaeon SCGC-AAA259D14]|uniref:Uncharacterized protein n=1 Tax=candidate division MSBL1 archaeon SCGC-AAA259D14 TaxID=1698261 RepID=A0A133U7Q3_9EURY|nr:hypothetical protein AKJ62_01365 [candidate division MSBL1 archaeon SCGC-AAA259D14]